MHYSWPISIGNKHIYLPKEEVNMRWNWKRQYC